MIDYSPRQWLLLIILASLFVFVGGMVLSGIDNDEPLAPATSVISDTSSIASAYDVTPPAAILSASGLTTATADASFDGCKDRIGNVAIELGATPSVIASDSTVHMVRFATVDGSVIATCSAADGRMAVTKSP